MLSGPTHTHTPPKGKHLAFYTHAFARLSELIQMYILVHEYTQTHTHTNSPWRIDKQAPGTNDFTLNKQPLLCLLHPTLSHPFPHGCHTPFNTIHKYTHIYTQTETNSGIYSNFVSCLITKHPNSVPHEFRGHRTPARYKSGSSHFHTLAHLD